MRTKRLIDKVNMMGEYVYVIPYYVYCELGLIKAHGSSEELCILMMVEEFLGSYNDEV